MTREEIVRKNVSNDRYEERIKVVMNVSSIIEDAMLEHGAEQIGSRLGVGTRDVEYKFRGKVVGIFVDGGELGEEELA